MAGKKQEMSDEEKQKIRDFNKKILSGNVSSVVGMNGVYAMGDEGRNIADHESLSTRFNQQRGEMWNSMKKGNKSNLPVEMPTNQAVVNYGLKIAEEAKQTLTIGELYEIVQGIRNTKALTDTPLPEKFKGKGLEDIAGDLEKVEGDISKLDGDAKEILTLYHSLSKLYDAKATERTFCYNNGAEFIEGYKQIAEKYAPEKPQKESK
jgi:hypothetical protein